MKTWYRPNFQASTVARLDYANGCLEEEEKYHGYCTWHSRLAY